MSSNADYDELMRHLRGFQRIVINVDYGGFSLSKEAKKLYLELSGIKFEEVPQQDRDTQSKLGSKLIVNGQEFYDRHIERDDPILVSVVNRLGSKASGDYARLKVVEIPANVDWIIEEYDGNEWVAEVHRTWR